MKNQSICRTNSTSNFSGLQDQLIIHFLTVYLSSREWQKELLKLKNQRKPSLLLALFRIWYLRFLLNSVLVLFEVNYFQLFL